MAGCRVRDAVLVLFMSCCFAAFASSLRADKPPNIVLLLADDQDLLLGGETPMQFTTSFFKQRGSNLRNFFVNTPVCCPSRATLISGRYPHNFLDLDDGQGCMHMFVTGEGFTNTSIGWYMKELGYRNGHFGKYFNPGPGGMGTAFCNPDVMEPLPGFDEWFSMCNDNAYFENVFTVNGKLWRSGTSPEDYMTSLIGNASLSFIQEALVKEEPFFAFIAPHAPHVPATPAPWYQDRFEGLKAPRTPNYNYTALDHHYVIRQQDHLTEMVADMSDELFRNRWRTLLSVDDIMIDVVNVVSNHGQLDNTYFLWTSDHGFQLGQFNLPSCKLQPYEHDLHVPFHIAGPKVPPGWEFSEVASMVDLAPTLIELGGGHPPDTMDGISFASFLINSSISDTQQSARSNKSMIEYWSLGNVVRYDHLIDGPNNTYIGARVVNETHNLLYVEYFPNRITITFEEDEMVECELFDMNLDYYQMKNLCGQPQYVSLVEEMHHFIHSKVFCTGKSCHDQL